MNRHGARGALSEESACSTSEVVIGYPVGGSATIPFVTSLNKLMQHEFAIPEQERMITRIIPASGLYVSKNRNKITQAVLGRR